MAPAARGTSIAALLIALALLPLPAQAQHRGGGVRGHAQASHGVGVRGHTLPSHGQQRFHHRPFGSRVVVVAPFVPFGFSSATSLYSPPQFYDPPPPVMDPAPTAYGPTPAYAAPPAPIYPPPQLQQDVDLQREVVFPTGRYVLRGDGITMPYTW